LAEPPSGWALPGSQPDDPGTAQPPGWGPSPAPPPGWGPPPAQAPGWGPPPVQPPGWGAPAADQPGWGSLPANGQPGWGPAPSGGPDHGGWTASGTGIIPLRPLTIGEIFDGSIRAIRANPGTMVGFSAIVIAILTLLAAAPQAFVLNTVLNSPLTSGDASENIEFSDAVDLIGAGGLSLLIGVLQFVLATTIVSGLLIVAVDSAVRGQPLRPGRLWARTRSRLPAVLGLACLVLLSLPLVVGLAMVPGLVVVFLPGGGLVGAILLVVGALVGLVGYVGLYFGIWAVAAPALLLENLGVFAALRRSFRLVRGGFWRVFGIGLLTAVISYIVRNIFTVPFSLVGTALVSVTNLTGMSGALVQLLIGDIGTILAGAVLYPFTAGVTALLYLDLRMRREGLDVELMRR
jgi:hypothetical protein